MWITEEYRSSDNVVKYIYVKLSGVLSHNSKPISLIGCPIRALFLCVNGNWNKCNILIVN